MDCIIAPQPEPQCQLSNLWWSSIKTFAKVNLNEKSVDKLGKSCNKLVNDMLIKLRANNKDIKTTSLETLLVFTLLGLHKPSVFSIIPPQVLNRRELEFHHASLLQRRNMWRRNERMRKHLACQNLFFVIYFLLHVLGKCFSGNCWSSLSSLSYQYYSECFL